MPFSISMMEFSCSDESSSSLDIWKDATWNKPIKFFSSDLFPSFEIYPVPSLNSLGIFTKSPLTWSTSSLDRVPSIIKESKVL